MRVMLSFCMLCALSGRVAVAPWPDTGAHQCKAEISLLQVQSVARRTSTLKGSSARSYANTQAMANDAPTFYLSPDGDDATGQPGSRDKAFRTLRGLLRNHDVSATGANIFLRAGTYHWRQEEGMVLNLVSPGVHIMPDPDDEGSVVFSSTDKLNWKRQGPNWCAPLPTDAETWLQVWHRGRSLVNAQAPDIKSFLEDNLPIPTSPTGVQRPGRGHVWDLGHEGMLKAPEQPSAEQRFAVPPYCHATCDKICASHPASGGKGCPNLKGKSPCEGQHGVLTDPRFASAQRDYVGGSLYLTICNLRQIHGPFPIVAHDPAKGTVTFDYSKYSCNKDKPSKKTDMFKGMIQCTKRGVWSVEKKPRFIVRGAAELDRPREWAVVPGAGICVRLDEADDPNDLEVRTRGRALTFIGSDNIVVRGLEFWATEFANHAKEGHGRNVVFDAIRSRWARSLRLGPAELINSKVQYMGNLGGGGVDSSSAGIEFDGHMGKGYGFGPCKLQNTLIERSWAAVDFWDCQPVVAERNTVRWIYTGNIFQIFFRKAKATNSGSVVAFNRLHDVGYAHHCDCSMVQARWGAMKELQVHHNWMYNSGPLKALRFDTSDNGGPLYKNVFWGTRKGFMVKGGMTEGNRIFYNTGFGNNDCDMSVLPKEMGSGSTTPGKKYNDKSLVFNNAADDWSDSGKADCRITPPCKPPCKSGSNTKHWGGRKRPCHDNPPVAQMLMDVANYMFRPTGAAMVGKADQSHGSQFGGGADIGAYEKHTDSYWMPGQVGPVASDPVPPNGSPYGKTHTTLAWQSSLSKTHYNVYSSTSFCKVVLAKPQSDAHKGSVTSNTFQLPEQELGAIVYWRVDTAERPGKIWCFEVSNKKLSKPWNGVTSKNACAAAAMHPERCKGGEVEPIKEEEEKEENKEEDGKTENEENQEEEKGDGKPLPEPKPQPLPQPQPTDKKVLKKEKKTKKVEKRSKKKKEAKAKNSQKKGTRKA